MGITPMELLLMAGLTARLTRLAVVDDIAEPARVAVVRAANTMGRRSSCWAASLLSCPHCVGFWVAAIVAAAWVAVGDSTAFVAVCVAGTLSYVAGHLSATLDLNAEESDDG